MQSFFLIQCNVPHRDKSRCVLTSGNVTADWCRFDTKIYYFIDSESWCLFPQLSSIMIVSSNLQTTDLFRVAIPSSIERNSTYNDLFRTWSIDEWRIIMSRSLVSFRTLRVKSGMLSIQFCSSHPPWNSIFEKSFLTNIIYFDSTMTNLKLKWTIKFISMSYDPKQHHIVTRRILKTKTSVRNVSWTEFSLIWWRWKVWFK